MLLLAFLACAAIAVVSVQEALQQRRSATAATDMRLAVLTIASIDDLETLDENEKLAFDEAMETIRGDVEGALHPLPGAERADMHRELQEMAVHGELLLAGHDVNNPANANPAHANPAHADPAHADPAHGESESMSSGHAHADHGSSAIHSLSAHDDLQAALRTASLTAIENAASSERRATVSGTIAAATVAAMAALLLRSRRRADNVAMQSEAYREAASRLGALLDQSPIATIVVGDDDSINYASGAARHFSDVEATTATGLARTLMGSQADALVAAMATEESAQLDIVTDLTDAQLGTRREFSVRAVNMQDDPVVQGTFVSFTETTADNHARRQLEHLADHDQLTDLPNRRALTARLAALCDGDSLLMIDLDGFKQTNDTYGHAAGDELLVAVARRFGSLLGTTDRLYRLGGDEFAIVTDENLDYAVDLANQLRTSLDEPIALSVGFETIAASFGVANHSADISQLPILRRADIALYDAKTQGGNRVEVLSDAMEERSVWLSTVARSLELARVHTEFHLVVQPIVDATTHAVRMLEALLRWDSPELGPVPPDVFITLAEESGRINEIGAWVLEKGVTALARMRDAGLSTELDLTINVSPVQLARPGFAEMAERVLRSHGIEARHLTIELTESAVVTRGPQIREELIRLRTLGCRIACDDFGSGYSNLGQLMSMPLDILKVDRSLLTQLTEMRRQMGDSPEAPCQVMSAIVSIGDAMNAITVGEGIETAQQATSLRESGVQLLQGYHFSRPVSIDEFIDMHSPGSAEAAPQPVGA